MNETNATDRNVTQATGIFRGHITLPTAFLVFLLVMPSIPMLFALRWAFDEVDSIRGRLKDHEKIIYGYIEKGAAVTPTPAPVETIPAATPPIIVVPRSTPTPTPRTKR